MPSSTKDRFTVDFEKIFFFSKNRKYFFETQYEPWADTRKADRKRASKGHKGYDGKYKKGHNAEYRKIIGGQGLEGQTVGNPQHGRHKRCVWNIATKPFPEAHFAVYPEELLEIPIKAGCPELVCKKCGSPRERRLEATGNSIGKTEYSNKTANQVGVGRTSALRTRKIMEKRVAGYTSCRCKKGFEPGIVLDPFIGSGTTALVALKLNRRFIGIETNQEYIDMAVRRIKSLSSAQLSGSQIREDLGKPT